MKPYIFDTENPSNGWFQDPEMNVSTYSSTQHDLLFTYKVRETHYDFKPYLKICFNLQMKAGVKYYISYSEIYTYSMLLHDIEYLQTNWKIGFNQHLLQE